jgi:hypothetical protein
MHADPDPPSSSPADGDVAGLQREVERLRDTLAERDDMLREARERFEQDLQQARRELAAARAEQERLAEELSASRSGDQAPASPVSGGPGQTRHPRWWRARLSQRERRMQHDVQLLYQSGLFDAEWYCAEYPDVANTGMNPAEHYMLHGAFEGRNPGPQFDTRQYLFDHPDLVEGGENPLLHFIRSSGAAGSR